ncbi:YIEGIA family protein [Natroniella sulfidigena]|uniref:YIEGIA family protein n=1 Tax=Natroniella sulfidigena TaxID=723921 RepID=UPI00200B0DF9|nr:YIEGIA family protein [Natroniella sulfidigena]MCK8817754.1 YIEGIA family protein [Natroniella sulfidigena]
MDGYEQMILLGIGLGTLIRMIELKVDYRQYPGYPHGYVVHTTLGFIAAALGALVIPALLEENYVAVTILGAAAQQFQSIRTMERDFLTEIEETELVPRGIAYIENIAKVFEARNYLAMITAFITTIGYYFFNLIGGLIAGGLIAYFLDRVMVQDTVGNIANIRVKDLEFSGPTGSNIGVEDVVMMNVGLNEALEEWEKSGIGIVIEPKDDDARATLANIGQRQAIVHDVANQLGVKLDIGVVDYTPLARLNLDTGRVYMIIIPIEPDEECVKEAVSSTPILEEARRRPLESKAGSAAAD